MDLANIFYLLNHTEAPVWATYQGYESFVSAVTIHVTPDAEPLRYDATAETPEEAVGELNRTLAPIVEKMKGE